MRFLSTALIFFITSSAFADTIETREVNHYFRLLSSLNSFSPLEGAGSHGSQGISMGLGWQKSDFPKSGGLSQSNFYMDQESEAPADAHLSRLTLIKGLMWPIDIGASFGVTQQSRIQQWAGYGQWTLFEQLALPALALRATYAKLYGLQYSEFSTAGVHGTISQAILGVVTVYASIGRLFHKGKTSAPEDQGIFYLRVNNQYVSTTQKRWQEDTRSIGLRLTFLPPFFAASFELQKGSEGTNSFLGKLAVGI